MMTIIYPRIIIHAGILFTIAIVSCITQNSKNIYPNDIYKDTTYSISTQQLKSNNIPDSVFRMAALRHLSITGMDCDYGDTSNCWAIKKIPAEIKNLKNLTTLSLTVNAISILPNEITALPHLTLLDLTDNPGLKNINSIISLKKLQYLYLYGCGLTKLPGNIGDLKYLKELGLTGNNINKEEQLKIKKALPNCDIHF